MMRLPAFTTSKFVLIGSRTIAGFQAHHMTIGDSNMMYGALVLYLISIHLPRALVKSISTDTVEHEVERYLKTLHI
jgi:hypothetical protein